MLDIKDLHRTNIHIKVQNFGPIEKAEIDLRPLTVFVGESNTGKTYFAALIYALHRTFEGFPRSLLQQGQQNLKETEVFKKQLKRCFSLETLSDMIRFTGAPQGEMKVSLQVREKNQTHWTFNVWASRTEVQETLDIEDREGTFYGDSRERPNVYYLPATRRSILQSFRMGIKPFIAEGIHLGPELSAEIAPFSAIETDFLKQLISYKEGNSASAQITHIAQTLEREVLRGAIEVKRGVSKNALEFCYRPQKSEQTLPVNRVSSMVSELAPLLLFLRGVVRAGDTLIIEEPEAHLHPGAQTQIAFTLSRLIRAGVRVVVTTHSEWLLQEIGNLIREGELKKLAKNRAEPESWMAKEEVGVWWFHPDKPVTEIPFDRIEGVEPQDYYDIADKLYNSFVRLEQQFLDEEAAGAIE